MPFGVEHFWGDRRFGQSAFGELSRPAIRRIQIFQQDVFQQVAACKGRRFGKRPSLRSYAPDAPMRFVSVRVAEAGLVMADDRVIPITNVERAVRSELRVHGTERTVRGRNQGLKILERKACAVFNDAQRPNGIVDVAAEDQLPLPLIRKMHGAYDVAAADFSAVAVAPDERRRFYFAVRHQSWHRIDR